MMIAFKDPTTDVPFDYPQLRRPVSNVPREVRDKIISCGLRGKEKYARSRSPLRRLSSYVVQNRKTTIRRRLRNIDPFPLRPKDSPPSSPKIIRPCTPSLDNNEKRHYCCSNVS